MNEIYVTDSQLTEASNHQGDEIPGPRRVHLKGV